MKGGGACLSGGKYEGAGDPTGCRLLMYWYNARRSGSDHLFNVNHGMGGRVRSALAYGTHCASVIRETVSRRLAAYVVPHGPLNPSAAPISHSLSGTWPSRGANPAVWQSLQPPHNREIAAPLDLLAARRLPRFRRVSGQGQRGQSNDGGNRNDT